jgi:hypothetical protein
MQRRPLAPADQALQLPSWTVAEVGTSSDGKHGSEPAPLLADDRAAGGEHSAIPAEEAAAGHPAVDHRCTESHRQELGVGDDPVLALGQHDYPGG